MQRIQAENLDNVNNVSTNNIVMDIAIADLSCPISEEIFFDPMMVTPCGHFFEEVEINKWSKENDTCPCCRKTIEGIVPVPPFFHTLLENSLKKYPKLQQERFFSLRILFNAVEKEDEHTLEKIITFLKIVDKHLNFISEEVDLKGISSVYLLSSCKTGIQLLKNSETLLNKIDAQSLNSLVDNLLSSSAVYSLAYRLEGRELIYANKSLRNKINSESLNTLTPISNKNKNGPTAVYHLARSHIGRLCFYEDEDFRAKISEIGLNATKVARSSGSAVYWFSTTHDGRQLLCQDKNLRSKINYQGLNAYCEGSEVSAVYWFAKHANTRQLLCDDAELRAKITEEGLNDSWGLSDEDEGTTPLYWLVIHYNGLDLLSKDDELRAKINSEGLNTIRAAAHALGDSALYQLTKYKKGRELLLNNPVICQNLIKEETLNTQVAHDEGRSAAYWLQNTPEGLQILDKYPELNDMIYSSEEEIEEDKAQMMGPNSFFHHGKTPHTKPYKDEPREKHKCLIS